MVLYVPSQRMPAVPVSYGSPKPTPLTVGCCNSLLMEQEFQHRPRGEARKSKKENLLLLALNVKTSHDCDEQNEPDQEDTDQDQEVRADDQAKEDKRTRLTIFGNCNLEAPPQRKYGYRGQTVDLKKPKATDANGIKAQATSASFKQSIANPSSFKRLLGLALFVCILHPAVATQLVKSWKHVLSPSCYGLIEDDHGDCPSKDGHPDFKERHEALNSACCYSCPGCSDKVVHCQMDYDVLGTQFSRVACIPPINVPPGYSGRIVDYDTSTPSFRLTRLNETSHHEDEARKSWEVTYPYGIFEKTKCTGPGEELLCNGGEGHDNRCTCGEGFKPIEGCEKGFTKEAPCHCEKMECSPDSRPIRFSQHGFTPGNISCRDLYQVDLNFTCKPDPQPAQQPKVPTNDIAPGPSSSVSPHDNRIPRDTEGNIENTNDEFAFYHVLWALIAFCAACMIIFCFVVITVQCRKRSRHEDKDKLKMSESTEADVEQGLDNPAQEQR